MPAWKPLFPHATALIVTFALTACPTGGGGSSGGGGDTPTARSAGTEKNLSFGGKVTIKSSDKFTDAEWNTLCDKVAAMFKKAYDNASAVGKTYMETQFAAGNTKTVILGNNFSNNWETKTGESEVLYVKTTAIDSINATAAIDKLLGGEAGNG